MKRIAWFGRRIPVFFIAGLLMACFSVSAFAFELPATGQTTCYDAIGKPIDPCPVPDDPMAQDGTYHNINPMSFTVIGVNSDMVQDNNTGCMWQLQVDGQTYNWFQAAGVYNATYNSSLQNVCGALNLGGYSDWRLPTRRELLSIVDYSMPYPGPAVNSTYFPYTNQPYYWSSTPGAAYPDFAWVVSFADGAVPGIIGKYNSYMYVRCVRGGQYPAQNFTKNGTDTVTDNNTGLIWEQGEPGVKAWAEALRYCEDLELPPGSGQHDWRLPNIKELESITIYDSYAVIAIDKYFFPGAYATYYWSSTTNALNPGGAWGVNFSNGVVEVHDKDEGIFVRCVSGGGTPPTVAAPLHAENGLIMTTIDNSNFAKLEYYTSKAYKGLNHYGDDLALSKDGTENASKETKGKTIYAICDGKVDYINPSKKVEEAFMKIHHTNCNGEDVIAYYGHIDAKVGYTTIERGDPIGIGIVKNWGGNSHLHLTIDTKLDRDLKRVNCEICDYSLDDSKNVTGLSNCQLAGYSNSTKSCSEFIKQIDNNKMLLSMGWGRMKTVGYKNSYGKLDKRNLYIIKKAIEQLGFISFFDLD